VAGSDETLDVMHEALGYGLATLREAGICTPMVLVEDRKGERTIKKALGRDFNSSLAMAMQLGQSGVAHGGRVAVVWTGWLETVEEGRFDAVILEGLGRGEKTSILMAQRITEPRSPDEAIEPTGEPEIYEDESIQRGLVRPPRWRRRWFI
jgi:hypothetical protein